MQGAPLRRLSSEYLLARYRKGQIRMGYSPKVTPEGATRRVLRFQLWTTESHLGHGTLAWLLRLEVPSALHPPAPLALA